MFCRIILTAIAISCTFSREITVHARAPGSQPVQIKDVICVLLLSGLQKEDLDENTLAKLRRHHVDINVMNNESLRQECIKQSYLDNGKDTKAYEITEDPNDKARLSVKKQIELLKQLTYRDDLNVDKQKSETVAPKTNFFDKINIRNIFEDKETAQSEQDRADRARMRSDDINTTMLHKGNEDQQVQYVKDQPSLDNLMKFWAKLNEGNTKAIITEVYTTTTYRPPPTEERIETSSSIKANLGNAHSQDMEYINKMIAEYIGKQTVPTTTQISPRSTKNMDIVSKTIKELLDRSSKTDSIPIPKNMENIFGKNVKEFSDLTALAKLFQTYQNEEDRTEKALPKPQKVIYDDNMSDQIKRLEKKSYSSNNNFTPKVPNIESERKMQALQYLNNMLKVTNNRLSTPISSIDVDSQDTRNNKDQEVYEKKQHDTENESNNKVSDAVQSTNLVKDISADVIKEIAEKVKEIVMRDIRKEIPTTEKATTTTTTTARSTTANPTVKVPNDSNVIKTLMDFFKEYKTMKDAIKGTTDLPMKVTYRNILSERIVPPVIGGFNPYVGKALVTDLKRFEMNPYNPNIMPIPFGKMSNPPPHEPPFIPQSSFNQKIEYQMSPITFQTNSAEIPPLVIQVSKPIKVINQHIIVTTLNPFDKQRDKKLHDDNDKTLHSYKYGEPLHSVDERNHLEENPTYADLTRKLRIAENVKQEFRESYKDKLQKIKERMDRNKDKTSELNPLLGSNHGFNFNGPMESNHHVSPSVGSHHNDQIVHSNRHHYVNRLPDSHHHKTLQSYSNHRVIVNEPAERNKHESSNEPTDSIYRDIITKEFLKLVDSNHDVLSKMVESSPYLRRPIDLDRIFRNHQSDTHERHEHESSRPRYKVSKFHEKLEQVENQSQNKYEGYFKATTEGYCGTVAARDQMPLMKTKHHTRFDDSNFNNFLKSQQKVTDMLEKILAAKTKAKTHSSEKR